ncbi:hypothetical protein NM208_g11364 [Fusarium decemcellulare]|uniref:Uncharacterized protein n=1 Tax=Fusarium decemcellulare TaxID=57161 RepID=A0ACC1RT74_9HYPO|nr:hypothetical protein NM208_g11364 [Fusarium decemcellulare]
MTSTRCHRNLFAISVNIAAMVDQPVPPAPVDQPFTAAISRKAMNEKFALVDLIQHHVKMSKRKGIVSNGPLLYQHFLMLVFKEWTTATKFNPTPSMKLRSFTDSNVKVASLAQDHPPSGAQVKAGRQIRDARRCGAPVYLGITLNLEESTIGYLWRDQTPEFINPKHPHLSGFPTHHEREKDGMVVIATAIYQNFQFLIFSRWTSAVASNPGQALKPRLFTDTSVKVGTLAQDHPLSDAQIKAGLTSQPRDERRCGAPVFLGITLSLDDHYIAYLWCDSNTEFINPKYIRFDPGMTRDEARQLAIDNYDQCEQQRIETYNTTKIINAARRRIVKWARAGSSNGFPTVDAEDRVDDLKPLVLASDFLIGNFEEYKKLVETIQERRSVLLEFS